MSANMRIVVEGEAREAINQMRATAEAQRDIARAGQDADRSLRGMGESGDRAGQQVRTITQEVRQFTPEVSAGGRALDAASSSIAGYVTSIIGISAVRHIITTHIDDLERLRDAANKLVGEARGTKEGLGLTAAQLFGTTSEKAVMATSGIVNEIVQSSGLGWDAASCVALQADIVGGQEGWFGRMRPGGPGGADNAGAMNYAKAMAQAAQTFGIKDQSQIQILGQLAVSADARTPEKFKEMMAKLYAGYQSAQAISLGAFINQIERGSQLEIAQGESFDEIIARAAQFRQTSPTEFLAANMQREFTRAALDEDGMRKLARRMGETGRVRDMSFPQRIDLLERGAEAAAAGGPSDLERFKSTFGGREELLRAVLAYAQRGMTFRRTAEANIAAVDPGEVEGLMQDATQSDVAKGNREAAIAMREKLGFTGQPGLSLQADLFRRFAPGTPEHIAMRQRMGFGGSVRNAAGWIFGSPGTDEFITEQLAIHEAVSRARAAGNEARASGRGALAEAFAGIIREGASVAGVGNPLAGLYSPNDAELTSMLARLESLLRIMHDGQSQDRARGYGKIGHPGD